MPSFDDFLSARIQALRAQSLYRSPVEVRSAQGPTIRIAGSKGTGSKGTGSKGTGRGEREVINLASNNYLGLADHPRLREAVAAGLEELGVGAGASRLISGTHAAHREAEAQLAAWAGYEDALLFSSGYAANLGALAALGELGGVFFSDRLNHASLIDGCRLSRARTHVFPHLDLEALGRSLSAHRHEGEPAVVITEAAFSMDGDLARLRELRALCDRWDAALMVDEAHSLGVIGEGGRGLAHLEGVRVELLVGTLGKSFGLSGAFVAGSGGLRDLLLHRARSFVFSTAPPAALARAIPVALELVTSAEEERRALAAHTQALREAARRLRADRPLPDNDHPSGARSSILPLLIGDEQTALRLSGALLERGVFAQAIRPPTVPAGTSRLRLTAMASHRPDQIEAACQALAEAHQAVCAPSPARGDEVGDGREPRR